MIIKSIQIKNFRSIINQKLTANNLTLFVGNNDAGKSNIIKALNLFFNDQTDFNTFFEFDRDYSLFAPSRKKMAKEIIISLEIIPPITYKASKNILWTKTWRKEGVYKNNRIFIDKKQIDESRSRIGFWLDHIVFRYIPATKSNTYFQELLGDLHDTLTESVEKSLISASTDFTNKLQENTQEITSELTKRINIDSNLQMPTNLRQLFQTLDFETKIGVEKISLNNRGDGIKSRHIPIILKFISEQDNKSRTQGAPRISTIWGYEEPENNLELTKSFELAKDFYEYSSKIQLFVTTHSPSFYGIKHIDDIYNIRSFDPNNIYIYFISNENDVHIESKTILIEKDLDYVHDQLGLLPLITPYIKDKVKENTELNQRISKIQDEIASQKCPTIFVEGVTDQKILKKAIELYSSKLNLMQKNNELNIKTQRSAGVNWISDSIKAWVYSRKEIKIAGILDFDEAGNKCKKEILENDKKCKKYNQNGLLKLIQIQKPLHIIDIYRVGIKIPITMEELYPFEIWEYARKKYYLENREDIHKYLKKIPPEISIKDFLIKNKSMDDQLVIYCIKKVKDGAKEKLANYLVSLSKAELKPILINFENIINKLENFFI